MHLFGEHGLIDAAVEAAKLKPHSWQAAKLRSVGGALGGVRSAAAALCFQLLSLRVRARPSLLASALHPRHVSRDARELAALGRSRRRPRLPKDAERDCTTSPAATPSMRALLSPGFRNHWRRGNGYLARTCASAKLPAHCSASREASLHEGAEPFSRGGGAELG